MTSTTPPADGRVRYASADDLGEALECPTELPELHAGAAAAFVDLGSRVPAEALMTNPAKSAPPRGLERVNTTRSPGCNAPDARVRVYPPSPESSAPWPERASQLPGWELYAPARGSGANKTRNARRIVRSVAGDEANARRASAGRPPEEPPRRAREATRIARMGPVETN